VPVSNIQYPISHSLFVPYWSLNNLTYPSNEEGLILSETKELALSFPKGLTPTNERINSFVYFGLSSLTDGSINKSDAGYLQLPVFSRFVSDLTTSTDSDLPRVTTRGPTLSETKGLTPTILSIRMLDPSINESILENETKQSTLISEIIDIAKENNFSEILLDLEMSATLPTDKLTQQINSFVVYFSKECAKNNLTFSITLYGDIFYRNRPYDVKTLVKYVNHIYIMAYDFHKSKGNPGPNFPLSGKEKYGYDIKTMINDFLIIVPNEKITFVLGMYGYEWTVDEREPTKA
jgi:spore germination protein YaaH